MSSPTSKHSYSARSIENGLLAGYAAGTAGIIIGHPLDSIKVLIQTNGGVSSGAQRSSSRVKAVGQGKVITRASSSTAAATAMHPGALSAAPDHTSLLGNRSLRGLYAGMTGPLLTSGIVQSLNFAMYDTARRVLYDLQLQENPNDAVFVRQPKDYLYHDNLSNVAMASFISGSLLSVLTSPSSILSRPPTASSLPSTRPSVSSSYPSMIPSTAWHQVVHPPQPIPTFPPTDPEECHPNCPPPGLCCSPTHPATHPAPQTFQALRPRHPLTPPTNPRREHSAFRIRLHWQPGYMWQELPDEGWFCLACARCDLDNLFGGLKGCDIATYCKENMHLALTGCEPSRLRPAKLAELASFKFLFDEVEDGLDGDQIQIHGTNLCIQQVLPGGTGSVELRQCDSSLKAQRFWGARPAEKAMELIPVSGTLLSASPTSTFPLCVFFYFTELECMPYARLTSHLLRGSHHPRQAEQVYAEGECRILLFLRLCCLNALLISWFSDAPRRL